MRTVYTDGSAFPNPGRGGFAVVENGEPIIMGAEEKSTNIRMEAMAIIAAIEKLGDVKIKTDSEFWVNVLTKWAKGWEKREWKKKDKKPIQNLELVQRAYELYTENNVELEWVRGHDGLDDNETADMAAGQARRHFVRNGFHEDSLDGLENVKVWVSDKLNKREG